MNPPKIFLSPSNQSANVGAYKNTNEHEQCLLIANAAKEYLHANYNCLTEVADRSDNMKVRAQYANAKETDIYVAIHTNAFRDPNVKGTETFYHSSDSEGKKLAQKLLDDISKLTGVKRKSKANDSLIELNTPNATRAYIEVDFHTNPERAEWIKNNTTLIGETIAKSIADFAKIELLKSEPDAAPPKEEAPIATPQYTEKEIFDNIDVIFDTLAEYIKLSNANKKYYRVQAGAYTNKENAQKLAEELKKAGFNTIIKYY